MSVTGRSASPAGDLFDNIDSALTPAIRNPRVIVSSTILGRAQPPPTTVAWLASPPISAHMGGFGAHVRRVRSKKAMMSRGGVVSIWRRGDRLPLKNGEG